MSNLTVFNEQFPEVAKRGIDEPTWLTLKNSLYTGAADESVLMVIDYCASRGLDPLMKPVHIVPMSVKVGNEYKMKDVVMAGINTYRIMASRSNNYAGTLSPVFGDDVTTKLGGKEFTYPEWCEVTVRKIVSGQVVDFTAREYYTENYATKSRSDNYPNAMWAKRPKGQLAKCAEAQALRKGFPEIGQQPTYEEMDGKIERDITPKDHAPTNILVEATKEPTAQEWFDSGCDWIDIAETLGELQAKFAEAYKGLQKLDAKNEMASLKAIYDEKKELLNE